MTFFQENAIVLYIEIGVLAVLVVMTDLSRTQKIMMNAIAISALLSAAVVLNTPPVRPRALPVAYQELCVAQLAYRQGPYANPVPNHLLRRRIDRGRLVSAHAQGVEAF